MPAARATAISLLVSIVKVVSPSTSDGTQSGVVEGVAHRLGRQPQLAAAGVLREVGSADADNGRLARQHQASPIVSVLVAMT